MQAALTPCHSQKKFRHCFMKGRNGVLRGIPNLLPSTNNNLDLKWDFYLAPGELFSVTVFGKVIQDPISRVEINSANGFLSYANIADQAKFRVLRLR